MAVDIWNWSFAFTAAKTDCFFLNQQIRSAMKTDANKAKAE